MVSTYKDIAENKNTLTAVLYDQNRTKAILCH